MKRPFFDNPAGVFPPLHHRDRQCAEQLFHEPCGPIWAWQFTFIGKTSEVAERMSKLLAKLSDPVLTDLKAQFRNNLVVDTLPGTLPDLYSGEPIVFSAKLPKGAKAKGMIDVSGRLLDVNWTESLDMSTAILGTGIAKLWAKRKVGTLMEGLRDGKDMEQVRIAVVDVALAHQVTSPYTSLVAVAKNVSRPKGEKMTRQAVPGNPPEGWTPPSGANQQHASPLQKTQAPNLALNAPAQLAMAPTAQVTVGLRAQGATRAILQAAIGLFALLMALGLWFLRRRIA